MLHIKFKGKKRNYSIQETGDFKGVIVKFWCLGYLLSELCKLVDIITNYVLHAAFRCALLDTYITNVVNKNLFPVVSFFHLTNPFI